MSLYGYRKDTQEKLIVFRHSLHTIMFSFEIIRNFSKERGEFLATAGIGNVTLFPIRSLIQCSWYYYIFL